MTLRRRRWLRVAVVALVFVGLLAITYLALGRPPWWLRIVLGVAFLFALELARSPDDDGESGSLPPGAWSVRLVAPGPAPIHVIKVLREHLPLSLQDAKAIVDAAPAQAVTSVSEDKARRLAGDLTLARAEATPVGPVRPDVTR